VRLDDRAADSPQNTSYKASERSEPAGPPTYGGYSTQIVVTERFTLKISTNLDPERAAPLLCEGITTYSPLRQWNCKKGDRVGVVGLGGLGTWR
jgi:D-arabinose 1-dehydrogenase-like Zn-dependent alcohol dehydrogenase